MLDYHFDFENRWYLALLALVPLLWILSYRSLAGLGRIRRVAAILLRSLVLILLIFALAEMQKVRISDQLTVLYVMDQSLSISPNDFEMGLDYVNAAIRRQRGRHPDDQAGVIVFGREAAIELPPLDEDQQAPVIESIVDREYTNLTAALKLAQASFPHDTAKRVVILTDGNENLGDALTQARRLIGDGIGVDVVPIRSGARGEVAVEKVTIPSDVRRGQPFDLHAVLNNTSKIRVRGRLQITRRAGEQQQVLADDKVELDPGKRVFSVREEIYEPDFYSYDARFIPDDPADDSMPQNNRATAFTHVRGTGQALLIEDHENKGEFDRMVAALRAMNLEVEVRATGPEPPFDDLAQLQPFDTVLLANVPREHFSDEQMQMLVQNTQNMGGGLVMLGGPNSFGAGGWTNTPLEEAMPVDFQIKSTKVVAVGALALMMHASEMPEGNHWQKVIAQEAIRALGNQDWCGLLHWDGNDRWLWAEPRGMVRVGPNRRSMLARLDMMAPGDMPQFGGAMQLALTAFTRVAKDAAVKHMIIISDGDPTPPSNGLLRRFKAAKVTVTTVGVGTHGQPEVSVLQNIATMTGGKFYNVTNPKMLPKIYQKEARQVSRPLVFEYPAGFAPQVQFPHEMILGISSPLPPITGYVMTTVKDNPLVEVSLVAPLPSGQTNAILASWTYGLGKSVAFTTDAGSRWATSWTKWSNFDKLFSQVVRWSMRPVQDTGKFTVITDLDDGKIKVVVTALDKNDEFLNFLDLGATVVGPTMKPLDLTMRQIAPGRYVGELESNDKGNYFIMISPGPGRAPIRTGINVPYSEEFRDRQADEGLLKTLAGLAPRSGLPGKVIDYSLKTADRAARVRQMLLVNTFRHDLPKATSSQDIWHLLLLIASCLFFCDVFVRRVNVSFAWAAPLAAQLKARLLRREVLSAPAETMQRLRSRKAEVGEQLEQRRSALRFEPERDADVDLGVLSEDAASPGSQPAKPAAGPGALGPQQEQADSYTSRLLKAKQRVWEERKKDE